MISKKITPELKRKLFRPQGPEVWKQHALARGLRATILKSLENQSEVSITEDDARLLAKIAGVLGVGNPAFNPFSGGRALVGSRMVVSSETIKRVIS